VVSLCCRVDPGESQREVRARRLVDQVLELAAAGGPARQTAADLMSEEYLAAAKLRFPPSPPDQGS
jgi:hypothetical protein